MEQQSISQRNVHNPCNKIKEWGISDSHRGDLSEVSEAHMAQIFDDIISSICQINLVTSTERETVENRRQLN